MPYNDDERGFTMDKKDEKQEKKCFIITPIGNENSDVFRKAKGVIESTIKPVLHEYGFNDIKPAYEINISGMINTQIINRIIDDDLVIANLTGNNPNVMYELCLRHVVAKPIIHICENGTSLPFDIKNNRTIFYENDMLGVEELKNNLGNFIEEIDFNTEYKDNPIYNAYRVSKLFKDAPSSGSYETELLKIILNKIESIQYVQPRLSGYNGDVKMGKGIEITYEGELSDSEEIKLKQSLDNVLISRGIEYIGENNRRWYYTNGEIDLQFIRYLEKKYNVESTINYKSLKYVL